MELVLDFLTELYKKGLQYSAINTARSTLSTFISVENRPVGEHPLVCRFLKGIFNLCPPIPMNNVIWDTSKVLGVLKTWSPVRKLSLKLLSFKVVMLLGLLTGQRGQTLHLMDIRNIDLDNNRVKIKFGDLLKTSRPGFHQNQLVIKAFAPDRRLCVCLALQEYITRTEKLRGNKTRLFISYNRPHLPIARDSISRWIKIVMKQAGINTNVFNAHSVRSAATSAAKASSVPLKTILSTAGWSRQETFARYYNKDIDDSGVFGEAILKKT